MALAINEPYSLLPGGLECNCEDKDHFSWPSGIRVFVDNRDITKYIFGVEEYTADEWGPQFNSIDLGPWLSAPGRHTIMVKSKTIGGVSGSINVGGQLNG